MHTIHNARIQLLATALNNLGVAAIAAGIVAPLVKGEINGLASVVIWLVIGLDFIGLAQVILGRLRS
jgi:hypothetical protein